MLEITDRFDLRDTEDLEILKEIALSIMDSPKDLGASLLGEVERAAIKIDVCPKCFAALEAKLWKEHHKVEGRTVAIDHFRDLFCPDCGWEED